MPPYTNVSYRQEYMKITICAVQTGRNVVHGSDSPENGERETGESAKYHLFQLPTQSNLVH